MTFDSAVLLAIALSYLGLLFLLAEATERGWIPARIARHPWVGALSLGVYASTWSYYGSVGFAGSEGYSYLTIYLGVTLACLLVPVVWLPVLRLSREHQLASLADLFAFRYRSAQVGVAVTLFLLAGSLPYLAQQIRAVAASVHLLTGRGSPAFLGLAFCLLIAAFAVMFGARHVTAREKHAGLVMAIAFESVVKLVALLSVGAFALFGVFDGPAGLAAWLRAHPEAVEELYRPVRDGPWGSLLLVSFAAAFLLPRQYHMAFTEAHDERSLRTAAWLFPLFLLLLNLSIPIILWAGRAEYPGGDADAYVLTITLHGGSAWMTVFIFLGGVSAASAMIIVSVLALASMCMNHLIVRRRPAGDTDLYAFLRWTRRLLVVVILLAAYGLFLVIGENQRLVELGLVSFVAVAQFLPGLFGVLFWRRASGRSVLLGLVAGIGCWLLFAVAPLLVRSRYLGAGFDLPALLGVPALHSLSFATFASLGSNALVMGWLSLRLTPSAEEMAMARVCIDAGEPLPTGRLEVDSPEDFTRALAPVLGPDVAAREVARALADTELAADESHPAELRRLRDQLQRNLSGLLGPIAAEGIVDAGLRLDQGAGSVGEKMRALELVASTGRRQDLAAELDQVRRYLRDVLEDLPVGVCAVGPDEDVVLWNRALAEITGVADSVTGSALARLPPPWGSILDAFARDPAGARKLTAPRAGGDDGRFQLRKSRLAGAFGEAPAGQVILVEDLTERASLEAKLEHHERLALIGQLAASVAHEVGNPLAAIASVAQNLQSEQRDADVVQRLQLIRDQVERIGGIVKAMVVYSRAGTSATLSPASRFSLGEAVDEAVSLVRLDPRGRVHVIHNRCGGGLHLYGDRTRIIQVFINLLHNACDASPEEEAIEVRARPGGDRALIEIVDHGAGVAAEVRHRIFEPFFTTKEAGKGTGLGLSLVYNIVRDHEGTLEVDSRSGKGTTIRLSLPLEAG
ncbi:MAG TPA: ATP-binding protein [Kofleriaceae bacterium]|nr:ATP-binding protein [Kofleriaceae bacterium]